MSSAKLVPVLEEMLSLMNACGKTYWDSHVEQCLSAARLGQDCSHMVRSAAGGMGSFSDFVLPGDIESAEWRNAMSRFDDLRTAD